MTSGFFSASGEHGARERRPTFARGRDHAEVGEEECVARTGVFERHDVAAQGNTRSLERIDDEAAMTHRAMMAAAAAVLPAPCSARERNPGRRW